MAKHVHLLSNLKEWVMRLQNVGVATVQVSRTTVVDSPEAQPGEALAEGATSNPLLLLRRSPYYSRH